MVSGLDIQADGEKSRLGMERWVGMMKSSLSFASVSSWSFFCLDYMLIMVSKGKHDLTFFFNRRRAVDSRSLNGEPSEINHSSQVKSEARNK